MARSKSVPGGKASRASASTSGNKEQTGNGSPANLPDVKAVAADAAPAGLAPGAKPALETRSTVESRKMEVVKNGARKNVVPINLEDEVRRRAYELYQQRGSGAGSEAEDWLNAEREIRQRYRQQSA